MISSSSSFLDLKVANAPTGHRIPRKPPPIIDQAERYPTPDPMDPFAPLWVLRNRTSSVLPGARSPLPPCFGPYGSQETINIISERRYSTSYLYSSSTSTRSRQEPTSPGDNYNYNMITPPGSPLKAVTPPSQPMQKATPKIGHYIPYSQINHKGENPVGDLQAFPRIATPCQSRTDIDLASRRRPWSPRTDNRSRSPQFHDDAKDVSSESETDEDDAYIKPTLKLRSPILIRSHTAQQYPQPQAKPKANSTHQRAQSVQTNAAQKLSPQSRLAKLLLPRKMSFLRGNGTGNLPSMGDPSGRRSSTAESRPISKSSISAPQAMVSTAIWDSSRNRSHRGRVSTTPITRADEMKFTKTVDGPKDNDTQQSQKRTDMKEIDTTGPTINSDCEYDSPAHLRKVLKPLPITQLTDKLDSDDHHLVSCEKKPHLSNIDSGSSPQKAAKRKNTMSVFQVMNMTNTRTFAANASLTEAQEGLINGRLDAGKSKLPPLPPLSPVQPSMYSTSNTSNVNISISTPSFATNPSEDDHRYTSPRPAPQPPMHIKPLLITKKKSKTTGNATTPTAAKHCGSMPSGAPACGCDAGKDIPHAPPSSSTKPKSTPTPGVLTFPTEWTLPTPPHITFAASLPLTCEDGTHVSFGSLFAATRTIVVFIRHFWCPLCQDYMSSLKSLVRPEMLAEWPAGSNEDAENHRARLVKFVVISNGAHGMIHKYKQIFGLPFKVYTDPSLAVYHALGMGRDGEDCRQPHGHSVYQYQQQRQKQRQSLVGPAPSVGVGRAGDGKEEEKCEAVVRRKSGGYVKHGLMGGIAMVVVRAIKVGMPVWEKGGDVGQLGGEFIFGPGLTCSFAHRMQTTKGHAPIEDVLTAAGIDVTGLSHASHEPFESIIPGSPPDIIISDNLPSTPSPNSTNLAPIQPRPRKSSLRNLTRSISLSRAASVASALSVGLMHKGTMSTGNLDGNATSKRNTRRYSVGINVGFGSGFGGMMSREEEERWMEQRQQSIERLRERKNLRRAIGGDGRAVSVQGYAADVSVASEASSVMGVEEGQNKEKEKQEPGDDHRMHWNPSDELEDMEVIGKMDEDLGLDTDSEGEHEPSEANKLMVIGEARRSLDSFSDTASSWSRSTAPPPEGGSYVFLHDSVVL